MPPKIRPTLPNKIQEQIEAQGSKDDTRKFTKKFKVREKTRKAKRKQQRLDKKRKRNHSQAEKDDSELSVAAKRQKTNNGKKIVNKDKNPESPQKPRKSNKRDHDNDHEDNEVNDITPKKKQSLAGKKQNSLDPDERQMRRLEKKLGIKSGRNISKVLHDDGLDDLLSGFEIGSKKLNQFDSKKKDKDVMDTTDEEENDEESESELDDENENDEEEDEESDQAISVSSKKYVPPHLRESNNDAKEELIRIQRQLQGLLNRLSEANIESIVTSVENLYQKYRRHDVTATITNLVLNIISSKSNLLDQFVTLYATFIAALYKINGIDFCAHFVQTLIEEFEKFHSKYSNNNNLSKKRDTVKNNQDDNTTESAGEIGKECTNLVLLISALYNFQVVSCVLIYDLVRLFIKDLTELNVELLLKVIKSSGYQLRQDDPLALKEIIQQVMYEINKKDPSTIGSRTKFMIETVTNLKNNRMKQQQHTNALPNKNNRNSSSSNVDNNSNAMRMKKFLANLSKKIHVQGTEALRLSLQDIHSIETKAKKQKMNTDVRRSIFIVLMNSEDFVDAFERLLKLNLKEVQEREIPRVLIHCCGNEKTHNPYYDLLAERLCAHDHSFKITFQYCLWDFLRECGEDEVGGMELLKKTINTDNDFESGIGDKVPVRKIVSLAKLYAWLLACGQLSIVVLKTLSFTKLKSQTRLFLRLLITHTIILSQRKQNLTSTKSKFIVNSQKRHHLNPNLIATIFKRAIPNPALSQGLLFFTQQFVMNSQMLSSEKEKGVINVEEEQDMIKWGCKVIKDVLSGRLGS
ncbi:11348_t:CDS:10 [Ambispora leptoticha]|uniref:11348_t:CDS:1 n=1 Tax=Ambispora leptoticha TaxID=144679 RepID=A0A9N9BSU2_9GLOM|nr:11348_t:CDS:10 [Ambispora leptoticha]